MDFKSKLPATQKEFQKYTNRGLKRAPTWQITTTFNYSSRGSDTLFQVHTWYTDIQNICIKLVKLNNSFRNIDRHICAFPTLNQEMTNKSLSLLIFFPKNNFGKHTHTHLVSGCPEASRGMLIKQKAAVKVGKHTGCATQQQEEWLHRASSREDMVKKYTWRSSVGY